MHMHIRIESTDCSVRIRTTSKCTCTSKYCKLNMYAYSCNTCAFDKNYAYLTIIVCVIFFEYPNGAPIRIFE